MHFSMASSNIFRKFRLQLGDSFLFVIVQLCANAQYSALTRILFEIEGFFILNIACIQFQVTSTMIKRMDMVIQHFQNLDC